MVTARQASVQPEPRLRVNTGFAAEWPGSDARSTECVINLVILVDEILRRVGKWGKECGIPSVAALNVLEIVRGNGAPITPTEIAERMLLTKGALTGILRTLEKHGMVRRVANADDARSFYVELTRAGRRTLEDFVVRLHRADRRTMRALTAGEREGLLGMVARLQADLPPWILDEAAGRGEAGPHSGGRPGQTVPTRSTRSGRGHG